MTEELNYPDLKILRRLLEVLVTTDNYYPVSRGGSEIFAASTPHLRAMLNEYEYLNGDSMKAHLKELNEELADMREKLCNLLARAHRDGGHYIEQHGLEKAAEDADLRIAEAFAKRDQMKAEVERIPLDLEKKVADYERRIRANERTMTLALIRQLYHELDADGFARKMCEVEEGRDE